MPQNVPLIELKVTLDQLNAILQMLGQQPFERVADIISDLRMQASQQLEGMRASNGAATSMETH